VVGPRDDSVEAVELRRASMLYDDGGVKSPEEAVKHGEIWKPSLDSSRRNLELHMLTVLQI